MVAKKLLTLACAVGILACGACFLPPSPEPKPQPPPQVRIDLTGIRMIRVEVVNSSGTHHLNGADLASEVAGAITARFGARTGRPELRASTGDGQGVEDAVFKITILSESLVEEAPSAARVSGPFLIGDSATLTRRDGVVLWQETNATNRIYIPIPPSDAGEMWKDLLVEKKLETVLANHLVLRMVFSR
jgi:hypothetical protein